MDDISGLVRQWPNPAAAAIAVTTATTTVALGGDTGAMSRIASISKVMVGLTAMVAVEEGTIDLDEQAGPAEATVRHLLAHASGLGFDDQAPVGEVAQRRIYSNAGIERFATHLSAAAEMPYDEYQREAVVAPLNLESTELRGSAAQDVFSTVDDLIRLARELLMPTLIAPTSMAELTAPQYPELGGVLPGFGTFDPNPWGLGVEIRGNKNPHWTAPEHSPHTFGHFGGTGTFLWVDPRRELAAVAISGTAYGPWANAAWPLVNQTILELYG